MDDTKRIEWLVANGDTISVNLTVNGYCVFDKGNGLALLGQNDDYRKAIDQAMTGGGECLFTRPTIS